MMQDEAAPKVHGRVVDDVRPRHDDQRHVARFGLFLRRHGAEPGLLEIRAVQIFATAPPVVVARKIRQRDWFCCIEEFREVKEWQTEIWNLRNCF